MSRLRPWSRLRSNGTASSRRKACHTSLRGWLRRPIARKAAIQAHESLELFLTDQSNSDESLSIYDRSFKNLAAGLRSRSHRGRYCRRLRIVMRDVSVPGCPPGDAPLDPRATDSAGEDVPPRPRPLADGGPRRRPPTTEDGTEEALAPPCNNLKATPRPVEVCLRRRRHRIDTTGWVDRRRAEGKTCRP